ncbi:hypothetical protein L2E82_33129 [Cichorium intybus]|uniref:Uncharacterized protein n=1 Tax=Cichorium intybus TaxID=13427 RepID=A0ACB9BJB7_CICIN|nr:hypothetical protein L2E82_33129 [Cichorium intybus]
MFISYVAFVFKYYMLSWVFLDLCFVEENNMVAIGDIVMCHLLLYSSFLFICLGTHVFVVVQLHTIKLNKCLVSSFLFDPCVKILR